MTQHIQSLDVDASLILRGDESRTARERVITDLLKESMIALEGVAPPYAMQVKPIAGRLLLLFNAESVTTVHEYSIPLSPFRRLMKDYHIICESYHVAIEAANTTKVEAIDMGRRGLHNEGAEKLMDLCATHPISMDLETARKLFSLVYFLHY
jgi:uncharacterized protein (UPF0262 family)